MPRVQRGNVILNVREDEVQHYLNRGYNHTSPTGEVLHAAVPNDMNTLQSAYMNQMKKIEELEATIVHLTAELDSYKRAAEKAATKKSAGRPKKSE